jgi:hypothetical protein
MKALKQCIHNAQTEQDKMMQNKTHKIFLRYSFVGFVSMLMSLGLWAQDSSSTIWYLNQTSSIGGNTTTALTALPTLVTSSYGTVAYFDGVDDGLLVDKNPLWGATSFTVEVFFRPDSNATNNEQRFIHIRNRSNDTRRVLMEIRQFTSQVWALDTYIKSDSSNLTLIDSSLTHPCGQWHHVALTYANDTMKQYVNGVLQRSGYVRYQLIDSAGRVSIGARQDPRSWFKGAIAFVKFSKQALTPSEFFFPTTTEVPLVHSIPQFIQLHQNFPNPFNPTTTITYELPKSTTVKLEIMDVLGKSIAVLVNGYQQAGRHTISWNAEKNCSGIYLYTLTTSSGKMTQRMMLLK